MQLLTPSLRTERLTMPTFRTTLVAIVALLFAACSGKDGVTGPEGPAGPQGAKGDQGNVGPTGPQGVKGNPGATGPQGAKGDQGNANVQIYEFGSRTFTGSLNLPLSLSRATVDSSVVFMYYNPVPESESAWYPIPGSGSGGLYETRYFLSQALVSPSTYTFGVRVFKPDGTLYNISLTFRKIRIVLVKASAITTIAQRLPSNGRDYNEMKTFFGLPE